MITSGITHKSYQPESCVYISNMLQAKKYLEILGGDILIDILWNSEKRPDSLVFVFPKNESTRELKKKWDNHEI